MSFEDLPDNARELPLTDARLAGDTVDLMLSLRDRAAGSVLILICDEGHVGRQPVVLHDVPDDADLDDITAFLDGHLLPMLGDSGFSILFARGRRHGTRANDVDRRWHQHLIDLCARHGVRLLGFHVATLDHVFALPEPLSAAS